MSRWARNVDITHGPIRDRLRAEFGKSHVIDSSRTGGGFPDLIVHKYGQTVLVECKTSHNKAGTVEPKRIEGSQTTFMATWQGGAYIIATSPDQAVAGVTAALGAK